MKRSILFLIGLLAATMSAFAQGPDDPNEGSRLTYDGATQTYRLSWWGQWGKSYFIQHSDDLVSWSYYPVIVVGQYDVAEINFQTNASRYFVRLELSDDPSGDSDGDGIPDDWEVLHGLNPHFNDAAADPDADGLSNYWEYRLGLDPHLADTGNTGIRDDLKDNDEDGLTNLAEITIHHTDPTQYDTDGDGLNDGWEARYGFDPLVDNTNHLNPDLRPEADPDGDGLTNLQEEQLDTNPFNADTDGDGITDAQENIGGSSPTNAASTPTNPGGTPGGPANPPAPTVPVAVTFGDPSGSHSEKYRVILEPLEGDLNTRKRYRTNQKYGETQTETFYLPKGSKYKITLKHMGTDPAVQLPSPDYDYQLDFDPSTGADDAAAVTDDPQGILGEHYESDPFFAAGKDATLYVAWLTSETIATVPHNRRRTKLGVGEPVKLTIKPSSVPAPVWMLTGTFGNSTINPGSSPTANLTAGERACTPTVEATINLSTIKLDFTVVQPSGLRARKIRDLNIPAGTQGAAMDLEFTVLPDDVSFNDVEVIEIDKGTQNVTGFFLPFTPAQLKHTPNPNWFPLSVNNTYPDTAGFEGWGTPATWSQGTYEWAIEVRWRVFTLESGQGEVLQNITQLHTIQNSAGTSIEHKLIDSNPRTP